MSTRPPSGDAVAVPSVPSVPSVPPVAGAEAIADSVAASRAAIAWMILACACFAVMNGLVRHLSASLPPLEIVFFRCLFGLAAMAPWLMRTGLVTLRTRHPWGQTLRALVAAVAMAAWFTGISLVPLAEATALSFTTPLFAAIAAVLVLGEAMRARRALAIVFGFAGALIILRPGFEAITWPVLCILGAAMLMAIGQVMVKWLARDDHPNAIVFWLVLLLTPITLGPALLVWQTPAAMDWVWLAMLGAIATLAHQAMTRSLAGAEATAVLPLDFLRLPFVAAIGYFAFAEIPDLWTWLGGGVIAGSSIYLARREALARRRAARLYKAG